MKKVFRVLAILLLLAAPCGFAQTGPKIDRFTLPLDRKEPYDEAIEAYEAGYTHYREGRFEKSAEQLLIALKYEPNLLKAHYWLGKVYREMGRLTESKFHWEEVIRLRQLIQDRRTALGFSDNEYPAETQVVSVIQRRAQAESEFRKARRLHADGHWDGAVAQAKLAVALYPANSGYLLFLSRLLWDTGDLQGSAKTSHDFLSQNSGTLEQQIEAIDRLIETGHQETAREFLLFLKSKASNDIRISTRLDLFAKSEMALNPGIGRVVKRMDGQVVINLGLSSGLKLADEYNLSLRSFRAGESVVDPQTGRKIGRVHDSTSGDLLVTKVFGESSWALIRREFGQGIKAGDLIEFKSTTR